MNEINNIIKKIEKLEEDFNLFNERIFEFANSTKNWNIDIKLLNNYINSLKNYLKLLEEYTKEIKIYHSQKEEYKVQKELILIRLEKLSTIFEINLKKLSIIKNSIKTTTKTKDYEKYDFDWSDQVKLLEENLYDFYNNYNRNLEYQKKFNITISLNNNFEQEQENKFNSLELTQIENKYIIELNDIFEDIEEIILNFNNLFTKSLEIDKNFFQKFWKFYFSKSQKPFVIQHFENIFKNKYENKNFNIKENDFYKDYSRFNKIINEEYNNFKIIINIIKFIKEYSIFIDFNNKYKLLTNTDFFDNNYNILKKFLSNNNYQSAKNLVENLCNELNIKNKEIITLNNNLFKYSFELLNNFKDIYDNYLYKLNFNILWNLYTKLNKSNVSDTFIKIWLMNIKSDLKEKFININLKWKETNELKDLLKYIKNINKNLEEIKSEISYIRLFLNNEITYNYNIYEKNYITKIKPHIKKLAKLFNYSLNNVTKKQFENYILSNLSIKFREAKRQYLDRKRERDYYLSSSSGYDWSTWKSIWSKWSSRGSWRSSSISKSSWSSWWRSFWWGYRSSGSSKW